MNGDLQKMIEEFLSQKKEIGDNGWANVTLTDMIQLNDIIHGLISNKFEADADGDLPVEFILVDRTQFESIAYHPNRYLLKATSEEQDDILRVLNMNLQIAAGRLDIAIKIFSDRNKENNQ